jgi:proton-translocating NADH-quinone oxidoreductase chain M
VAFAVDGVSLLFLMLSVFIVNFCHFLLDHRAIYAVEAAAPVRPAETLLLPPLPLYLWGLLGAAGFLRTAAAPSGDLVETLATKVAQLRRDWSAAAPSAAASAGPAEDATHAYANDGAQVRRGDLYVVLLAAMYFFVFLFFTTADLLLFFFAYEGVLVPMVLFIVFFGSRREKKQAVFYFCAYTLVGSLPLLLGIFTLWDLCGTTNLLALGACALDPALQEYLWPLFFISFAVKVPMVPLHLWLPEAHVEASTTGSVILAALLLKLGIYGMIRLNVNLLAAGTELYRPLVMALGAAGVVYVSLIIFKQLDLKKYVAYTSVVHMSMCVLGLFSGNLMAYTAAIFLAFIHGFVSTAMFFLIGILYRRYQDRSVLYYRGLEVDMPVVSFFFFLFSLANCAFPATPGFVGEFLLLAGLAREGNVAVAVAVLLGVFFSIIYSLLFYVRVFWGSALPLFIGPGATAAAHRGESSAALQLQDANGHETTLLGLLLLLTLATGFYPNFFLDLGQACYHLGPMGS